MKSRQRQVSEPALAPEMIILVSMLDESFEKKAWHGPNLKGSIRGLSADQAAWRPGSRRHTIVEQAIHAAYWKYAVRRRLRGDLRGSFPLKGSNWFPVVAPLAQAEWKGYLALLAEEHRALRQAIIEFPAERLHALALGGKVTYRAVISGIAAHDVYHAGQIQLLKRLQAER